jgi:hypothetical protein
MLNSCDKMIKIYILLIALFLGSSCKKEAPIPIKKMSKILLKMHLAEGYTRAIPKSQTDTDSIAGTAPYSHNDSLLKYNAMILKEFKITKSEFQKSLDYYKQKPVLLDSIYQIILTDIAVLQANNNIK